MFACYIVSEIFIYERSGVFYKKRLTRTIHAYMLETSRIIVGKKCLGRHNQQYMINEAGLQMGFPELGIFNDRHHQ